MASSNQLETTTVEILATGNLPTIVSELEKYDRNRDPGVSYDDIVPLILKKLNADRPGMAPHQHP